MIESVLTVLTLAIGAGALLKGLSWGRRRRMTRGVPQETIERAAWGVSLRVLCQGAALLESMSVTRANRTVGDVLVTPDRLLVVCGRGTLIDLRPGRGRALSSARSPGPGLVVLEGTIASIDGPPGRYRIEWMADDARAWVDVLARFTEEGNDGYGRALSA